MALSFAAGTGNLFNRLGRTFAGIKYVNTFLAAGDLSAGGVKSVGVFIDAIDAQYASARQDIVAGLYPSRDAARQALNTFKQQLVSIAQATLIEMVNDDHPLASKTLQLALTELIRQMVAAPATVDANTTSVTVTPGTNYGTHTLISSIKQSTGANREYPNVETVTVTCISDVSTGSASEGQEQWTATGTIAKPSQLDWDWPSGSQSTVTFQAVSADGPLNLLVNGDLEDFTVANTPDYWPITTGSAGTTILKSTGSYMGTNCLQFAGNGSELTAVYQPFDDSTNGTASILLPNTVYGVAFYTKVSSTPAAGVLEIALTNASGTIIDDDQGTDLAVTKALTAVSTTYVLVSGFFTTPRVLPTGLLRLRIRLSTALSNTHTVNIDNVTLGLATQLYQGGPWMFIVPGSVRSMIGDVHSIAVANDWAGEFQAYFQKAFDIRSFGLQLPSAGGGAETIDDALIV